MGEPEIRDFYKILNVTPDASEKTIRHAFQELAKKYHPDANQGPVAKEHFKDLVDAYRTLKDQKKRDEFDALALAAFCQSFLPDFLHSGEHSEAIPFNLLYSLLEECELEDLTSLKTIRSVRIPTDIKFRQLLITGPPCVGKTGMAIKLKAWSEGCYIDLAKKGWWNDRALSFRPLEIHIGLPYIGKEESLAGIEPEYLHSSAPLELDLRRLAIPPKGEGFFSINWRKKYAFDFILPPVEKVSAWRTERTKRKPHPGDSLVSEESVKRQLEDYAMVAKYFTLCGMNVFVREGLDKEPKGYNTPDWNS